MTRAHRGHLPTVAKELEAVLRDHGFTIINTAAIGMLLEAHKERFIDEQLRQRELLRRRAFQQEDLGSIRALLELPEVV